MKVCVCVCPSCFKQKRKSKRVNTIRDRSPPRCSAAHGDVTRGGRFRFKLHSLFKTEVVKFRRVVVVVEGVVSL